MTTPQWSTLAKSNSPLEMGSCCSRPLVLSSSSVFCQAEWFTMITDVCHRQQQVIDLVANLREQLEILHRKFEYHIKHRENIRVFDWRENDKSMRQEMADINTELTEALKALECIQAEYLELKGQQDELFGIPCLEPREVLTIQSNLRSASKK
ncbi:hypothetical protein BR93DRAFT_135054 [Coniochaeta sp. PMI_546]|nr:hypothetical protein BR93DRAFT_135054 [Coniochaeta sp. PMI_546]